MSSSSSISLLRSLLRSSSKIPDYNIKSYAHRRILSAYRKNSSLTGEALAGEIEKGRESLGLINRYGTINSLFPGGKNVMENVVSNFK